MSQAAFKDVSILKTIFPPKLTRSERQWHNIVLTLNFRKCKPLINMLRFFFSTMTIQIFDHHQKSSFTRVSVLLLFRR